MRRILSILIVLVLFFAACDLTDPGPPEPEPNEPEPTTEPDAAINPPSP